MFEGIARQDGHHTAGAQAQIQQGLGQRIHLLFGGGPGEALPGAVRTAALRQPGALGVLCGPMGQPMWQMRGGGLHRYA